MSESGFDYYLYKHWLKKFGTSVSEFELWLKKFLLQQAQRVIRDARLRSPVDTGFYRESWVIGNEAKRIVLGGRPDGTASSDYKSAFAQKASISDIKVVGKDLQVTIVNGAEYASFIEYGHGSYPAKYVLTVAIDKVQRALPKRFDTAFKQFLKEKGVT
jgi:hypothetical protein